MRFLRNLLVFVLWLLAFAGSLIGVVDTIPERFARPDRTLLFERLQGEFVRNNLPEGVFLLWLVVLIVCLLILFLSLTLFLHRRRPLRIERHVDGGRVLMSEAATKHYIATALSPFGDLVCKRIDLDQTKQGLEAIVRAELRTQTDVPGLERRLIERVHSALTEDLGIEDVARVSVIINDFGLPKGTPVKPLEPEVVQQEVKPVAPAPASRRVAPVSGQEISPVEAVKRPVEPVEPVRPVEPVEPLGPRESIDPTEEKNRATLFSATSHGGSAPGARDEGAGETEPGSPERIESKPDEKAP